MAGATAERGAAAELRRGQVTKGLPARVRIWDFVLGVREPQKGLMEECVLIVGCVQGGLL